jgi:hypothetical protein
MNDIKVGSLVSFNVYCQYEVVIDVYDDIVFHTISSDGTVMQYNIDNIISIGGSIDIDRELDNIKSKIPKCDLHNTPS